jgi:hypothetical protein
MADDEPADDDVEGEESQDDDQKSFRERVEEIRQERAEEREEG